MREYIKESVARLAKKNYSLHGHKAFVVNPFTNDVNFSSILRRIEDLIPEHLMNGFEVIYIGQFKDFHKKGRPFNATFKDGAIYISNDQDDDEDLIDDIIHELAHSIEKDEKFNNIIYGDGEVESEFLAKRQSLYHLLDKPTTNMVYYLNPEYDKAFDKHLYKDLGYDYLRTAGSGLFYSPYAITSLKEYWANGFENYLLGDALKLRDLSPVLFKKITELLETEKEEY